MNKAPNTRGETASPVDIRATDVPAIDIPASDYDPLVRQLSTAGTVVSFVLIGFLALGAVVATPVFGLVFGLMTLGLIGLGWVML